MNLINVKKQVIKDYGNSIPANIVGDFSIPKEEDVKLKR